MIYNIIADDRERRRRRHYEDPDEDKFFRSRRPVEGLDLSETC